MTGSYVDSTADSRKRRDSEDIIANMLYVAKGGALRTVLMYRANLSFRQLQLYLEFVLEKKLLEKIEHNNPTNKDEYRTTEKGNKYLNLYGKLMLFLE